MKNDPVIGCGISTIWMTREDDPFKEACAYHDAKYQYHIGTKNEADEQFFKDTWKIAEEKDSLYLKAKSYLFYGIVKSIGWMWW